MAREFYRFTVNVGGTKLRRETLEGRPHLVAEGAIIPDGVMKGLEGPFNYPHEENVKSVPRWNHMPIVLYHPTVNNQLVSARQVDVLNTRKVGLILNTRHDGKVRAEFWFDEERTKEVDERVYNSLIEEKPIEVSTGLGAQCDRVPGEVGGVKHNGNLSDYEPDHVAVLPDKTGAFSIAMGGGIFANIANLEMSYDQIRAAVSAALEAKYSQPGYSWNGYLLDVFDGYLVYCMTDSEYNRICYRLDYTVKDGKVELSGEPVEVVRTVQYKDVKNEEVIQEVSGLSRVSEKEKGMAFDKKAHVNSLIGNGFEEGDRQWLEGLPDDKLQKILPKQVPVSPPPVPPVVVNQTPAVPQLTQEQLLAVLGPQWLAVHNQGLKALANTKKQLIETIKANPNNKFTDEYLNNVQDLDMLAGMAELAKTGTPQAGNAMFQNGWDPFSQQTFAGAVGAVHPANTSDLEGPPEVPELFPEKKSA
jgi:hypothetical protein